MTRDTYNFIAALEPLTGIEKIVAAAGGQGPLAESEGITQQAVSVWVSQGWVPLRRVPRLAERYGVPAIELVREDIRKVLG
jgi:hypothetical protein